MRLHLLLLLLLGQHWSIEAAPLPLLTLWLLLLLLLHIKSCCVSRLLWGLLWLQMVLSTHL